MLSLFLSTVNGPRMPPCRLAEPVTGLDMQAMIYIYRQSSFYEHFIWLSASFSSTTRDLDSFGQQTPKAHQFLTPHPRAKHQIRFVIRPEPNATRQTKIGITCKHDYSLVQRSRVLQMQNHNSRNRSGQGSYCLQGHKMAAKERLNDRREGCRSM